MIIRTLFHVKLLLLLLFVTASCSEPVDTTKPEPVAIAFLDALRNNDLETAGSHLLPRKSESQEELIKVIVLELKEVPSVPEKPEFNCKILSENEYAQCDISNWFEGARVRMVFENGRWWVK